MIWIFYWKYVFLFCCFVSILFCINRFPKEQILVLFQEDMLRDTLGALRKVENFLGLPCFDFSSIVDLSSIQLETAEDVKEEMLRHSSLEASGQSSNNDHEEQLLYPFKYNDTAIQQAHGHHHYLPRDNKNIAAPPLGTKQPIRRVPTSYFSRIFGSFSRLWSKAKKWARPKGLQESAFALTRAMLDEVYLPHNRRLLELLQAKYDPNIKFPEAWAT